MFEVCLTFGPFCPKLLNFLFTEPPEIKQLETEKIPSTKKMSA